MVSSRMKNLMRDELLINVRKFEVQVRIYIYTCMLFSIVSQVQVRNEARQTHTSKVEQVVMEKGLSCLERDSNLRL